MFLFETVHGKNSHFEHQLTTTAMTTTNKELATDLSPVIRVYRDGTVERLFGSPHVPPSPSDPATGVSSKDISISPHISARLYLPPSATTAQSKNLPILVYFHGGGFCLESAFSVLDHNYLNSIVSQSNSIAVSVEYRLAPEHPLPIAYEDCWEALNWVACHSLKSPPANADQWLIDHADFDRLYIGGDSAEGNIVHNIALRAGKEKLNGGVKIVGGFLSHPYFLDSKDDKEGLACKAWRLVYPNAPGGIENPMINPWANGGLGLSGLGCRRLMVVVAEKDGLRDGGVKYCKEVRESGWVGEIELVEVEGEVHCFHVMNPDTDKAKDLIKRLALFIA